MDDILGLGKIFPLDKLVIEVSKGVGRLTKSYFDKKDIDNKAYEIRTLTGANIDALDLISKRNAQSYGLQEFRTEGSNLKISAAPLPTIHDLPMEGLAARTSERMFSREIKRQQNLEAITFAAAEQLRNEPEVDNDPVNETWLNRFLNSAEEVSEEELQILWGRILAGEVKKPKSYSLRTLDIIKNISSVEAKLITHIGNLVISNRQRKFLYPDSNFIKFNELDFLSLFSLLTEIGVVYSDRRVLTYEKGTGVLSLFLGNNKMEFVINVLDIDRPKVDFPIIQFTMAGEEIISLLDSNPPQKYMDNIVNFFVQKGCDAQRGIITNHHKDGGFDMNLLRSVQ